MYLLHRKKGTMSRMIKITFPQELGLWLQFSTSQKAQAKPHEAFPEGDLFPEVEEKVAVDLHRLRKWNLQVSVSTRGKPVLSLLPLPNMTILMGCLLKTTQRVALVKSAANPPPSFCDPCLFSDFSL